MAQSEKLQIFPSRANQVLMKQRTLAAKRGMGLLKRKRDAIDMKLRDLRRSMTDKEDSVDNTMRTAIFSVAKANLLGTDFKPIIVADSRVATAYLTRRTHKIVGVSLNYFELNVDEQGAHPLVGLSCGGQQVQKVRKYFQDALKEIVEYASLEYMLRMLKHASHQTNMRVNALDYVVIPRLVKTHSYICGELEEYEREDFYRLKRSQAKQLEAKIAFTEIIKTKNMTTNELSEYLKYGRQIHPVADVHFDADVFDYQSLEDRLRVAYHQRQSRRRSEAQHSDDLRVPSTTLRFLQTVAKQKDKKFAKASFVSLKAHAHNMAPTNSSTSSSEED